MTKKDFENIAKIIYFENHDNDGNQTISKGFIRDLCCYFKDSNPNFNSDKFKEACGWNTKTTKVSCYSIQERA